MRELVVVSGKGGTGKTSVAASLAALAQPVVLADCDVDAPDLHLLAAPKIRRRHTFIGGRRARIVAEECSGCGACADVCRFGAIHGVGGRSEEAAVPFVDPIACEGCGACVAPCPTGAMRFEHTINGEWFVSDTRFGPMVHARLQPGEENTGKLVSVVRRGARRVAANAGLERIISDGSPGIGCPVIASLTNAELALIVAEPTPAGAHDALRVLRLARGMSIPVALCVNRWDINPAGAEALEDRARALGAGVVNRVREDAAVVEAQMQGLAIVEHTDLPITGDLTRLWQTLAGGATTATARATAVQGRAP